MKVNMSVLNNYKVQTYTSSSSSEKYLLTAVPLQFLLREKTVPCLNSAEEELAKLLTVADCLLLKRSCIVKLKTCMQNHYSLCMISLILFKAVSSRRT